jgi:hypothetical protein
MSETNETQGRRQAVCVGIDTYPTAPLDGCVADAELWAESLRKLDFDVQVLTNQQATRQGILDALGALVEGGEAGDVLVFQFAGHGTQVPDLDGDEDDAKDEALCPVDVYDGAFVIDDDIWEVLGLPFGLRNPRLRFPLRRRPAGAAAQPLHGGNAAVAGGPPGLSGKPRHAAGPARGRRHGLGQLFRLPAARGRLRTGWPRRLHTPCHEGAPGLG